MNENLKKQLQEYFGQDTEVDFEKAEESDAIVKALETVNEYRSDFPDDLKGAIGTISKQAALYQPPESKTEKTEPVEKVGAKLSKDTLKKLREALKAIQAVLPDLKESTEKKDELEKALEKLSKTVDELTEQKQEGKESKTAEGLSELTKKLETIGEELGKRLAVVEKSTGVKKGLEGQDGDGETTEKLWPSLSG